MQKIIYISLFVWGSLFSMENNVDPLSAFNNVIDVLFLYKQDESETLSFDDQQLNKEGFGYLIKNFTQEEKYALIAFFFYKCKSKDKKNKFYFFNIASKDDEDKFLEDVCEAIIQYNDVEYVKKNILYSFISLLIEDIQSFFYTARLKEINNYPVIKNIISVLGAFFQRDLDIRKIKQFRDEKYTLSFQGKMELLEKALQENNIIAIIFTLNLFIAANYFESKETYCRDIVYDPMQRIKIFNDAQKDLLIRSDYPCTINFLIKQAINENNSKKINELVDLGFLKAEELASFMFQLIDNGECLSALTKRYKSFSVSDKYTVDFLLGEKKAKLVEIDEPRKFFDELENISNVEEHLFLCNYADKKSRKDTQSYLLCNDDNGQRKFFKNCSSWEKNYYFRKISTIVQRNQVFLKLIE